MGAGDIRRADITVRTPDNPLLETRRWVVCANARPYTYVGPRAADLCPPADLTRDLAVTAVSRLRLTDLLRITRTALTSDRIGRLPFVDLLSELPVVILEADRELPLQLDGDHVGDVASVELRSIREALAVIA